MGPDDGGTEAERPADERHGFPHRRHRPAAPDGAGDTQCGGLQGRWVVYFESVGVDKICPLQCVSKLLATFLSYYAIYKNATRH